MTLPADARYRTSLYLRRVDVMRLKANGVNLSGTVRGFFSEYAGRAAPRLSYLLSEKEEVQAGLADAAATDAAIAEIREAFARHREGSFLDRSSEQREQRQISWCEGRLSQKHANPALKKRFASPSDLLAFLKTDTDVLDAMETEKTRLEKRNAELEKDVAVYTKRFRDDVARYFDALLAHYRGYVERLGHAPKADERDVWLSSHVESATLFLAIDGLTTARLMELLTTAQAAGPPAAADEVLRDLGLA